MSCTFDTEKAFGPAVDTCRRFDFTLSFSEVFFQILPSCIFSILATIQLTISIRGRPRVGFGRLYQLKMVALVNFSALHMTTLIQISSKNTERTVASLPGAILSLVASLALIALSHSEHVYSHRPSFLISFYLLVTLLLRAATVRSYWLLRDRHAIASTSLATLVVQILVLVLENWTKERWFLSGAKIPPEERAGFLSRSLFLWVNRLMLTGYRRLLQPDDLLIIDSCLSSERVADEFTRLRSEPSYGPLGLIGICIRCLGFYFFLPVIPRLCMTAFVFSQPFLTSTLTAYLAHPESSPQEAGYGLIGAAVLVYGGIAISTGWYQQVTFKGSTKIRGGLVEAMGAKLHRIKQEKGVEAKILTLIISDVHRIVLASTFIHEFWAAPIEVSLGIWLLWRQVGAPSLAVLGIALISVVGSLLIGGRISGQTAKWLVATEKRIAATTTMLSSLKAIKMMGESQAMLSMIEGLRVLEFAASKVYRTLLAGSVLTSFSTLILSPVAVFGAYIGVNAQEATFDAPRMFSSLILISLVASPLIMLFQVIPSFGAAVGCARRVEEFLRKEEVTDSRKIYHEPTRLSGEPNPEAVDEYAGSKPKGNLEVKHMIIVKEVDITWDGRALLRNLNLAIARGQHIAITGPVGCGKSLLLQAILGEISPSAGQISVASPSIGYCAQTPWIENLSVGDNIFRGASDDTVWRDRVIDACVVRDLVDKSGSNTVGSGGARLSGGEKQRLALARAIATRPVTLILDDAFSAVDRLTKQGILDLLFGPRGIATELGMTVVQVVQDGFTAQYADTILNIDENTLAPFQFASHGRSEQELSTVPSSTESDIDGKTPKSSPDGEHADPVSIRDREVYRVYFKSIGRLHTTIFVLNNFAFAFMYRFPDIWARWWTEDAVLPTPTKPTSYWIGLYACWSALGLVTICIGIGHLLHKIVPRSGVSLHHTLLSSVLTAPWTFISSIDTGSILNRFNQDLMLVDLKLPLDLLNAFSLALLVIFQTILVCISTLPVLAVLPVLVAVLWALQHFYLRTSKRLRQLDLDTKGALHTRVTESYTGLHTIRAHGWSIKMSREFRERLDRSQDPLYLLWVVQNWLQLALNLIVTGLAVAVTGVAVATAGTTSASAVGVALLNLAVMGENLANLLTSWTSLETSLEAIARIRAFERDTPSEPKIGGEKQAEGSSLPDGWPTQGGLKWEGVWVTYHPSQEKPIWSLQDVSLDIQPGERIAVCGRSGSGKSTLLLALLGLVDTPRGKILLDGVDISTVPRDFLRSRYFCISQDGFMHSGSARDVLDPDGRRSDSIIEEALRACAMLDKITAGGGVDGQLAEMSFSVGEAQLFALARTILRAEAVRGGVVLFDEATSSVDTPTERRIMELMAEKLKGKTIISVLHRLETALEYDRVLVLDEGRVVSFDTPEETVKNVDLFTSFR